MHMMSYMPSWHPASKAQKPERRNTPGAKHLFLDCRNAPDTPFQCPLKMIVLPQWQLHFLKSWSFTKVKCTFSKVCVVGLLGPSFPGCHLGAIWGPSWAQFGAILRPSWDHLGASWFHLGSILGHLRGRMHSYNEELQPPPLFAP